MEISLAWNKKELKKVCLVENVGRTHQAHFTFATLLT